MKVLFEQAHEANFGNPCQPYEAVKSGTGIPRFCLDRGDMQFWLCWLNLGLMFTWHYTL